MNKLVNTIPGIESRYKGFTIVELLIVVVVIAILAAITIISYNGITQRANEAAIQSDLSNASKALKMYFVGHGETYPTANVCPTPGNTEICLESAPGVAYTYIPDNSATPASFALFAKNDSTHLFSFNGEPAQKAIGTNYAKATNLSINGNFSAGLSGWVNYSLEPSTAVVTNKALRITADPGGRAWLQHLYPGSYTDQDKVFYSIEVHRHSGSGMDISAHRDQGGYRTVIMSESQFDSMPTNKPIRYSVIRPFLSSQGTFTSLIVGLASAERTYDATLDNVVAINLTKVFGAGNEPTASEMESILAQFDNSWFAGTTYITY